jgi:hypothetical protein
MDIGSEGPDGELQSRSRLREADRSADHALNHSDRTRAQNVARRARQARPIGICVAGLRSDRVIRFGGCD